MYLVQYNGEHSITFDTKNSWEDWHLIPSQKPVIAPPSIKVKQVDIPGANGILDLTSVLTGYPTYNNRTGSLSFILAPGFESWETAKTQIMRYLYGRQMRVYLSDDPEYYYLGRVTVSDLSSDARLNGITIDYDFYPFKKKILQSDDDWLWDPFDFETGVIQSWKSLTVDGELELEIEDCMDMSLALITTDSSMTMAHTYTLANGEERSDTYSYEQAVTNAVGPMLRPGTNKLVFSGNGKVGVRYRGGTL